VTDASGPGGIVARRREFRGLRPGRRERQAKSAGGRLPLREFYEQKKEKPASRRTSRSEEVELHDLRCFSSR